MLRDLDPDQRVLADVMSEISERTFCAGWLKGLEYALWQALLEGPRRYGQDEITNLDIQKLTVASEKCGGWITFHDDREETWVPSAHWMSIYEQYVSQT